MTYITSVEEHGIEKGIAQGLEKGIAQGRVAGLHEGIALGLDLKFGTAAAPVIAEVQQLNDLALLEAVMRQIKAATTLDEVRQVYAGSGQ
jgi:hypothetical protein